MVRFWKPFRVVVSLGVLLLFTFIFIDFRQHLPSQWYKVVTWFQFIPSAREFLITFGFLSAGVFLVLLLTAFFGRVYCSVLCPLGIFQDLVSFISKWFKKKPFRFKYSKPKNKLRYTFLGLTIIPLFFGTIITLVLFDPYSNFGRFFSDLVRPLYYGANNLLANILIKWNVYSLAPEEYANIKWLTLVYTIIVLITVLWLSVKWGRLYCNTICPVGTFLGLISKFSFFKIKIENSSCTKCAKCATVCKSQCINVKEMTVDFTRCVGCFNCLKSCENESITYKFALVPSKAPVNVDIKTKPDHSKRTILLGGLLLVGALFGNNRRAKGEGRELKYRDNLTPIKKNNPCSPPGSKSIEHFNSACTACHLCVTACPNKVLQPSFMEYGMIGMLQPYMDATNGYCNFECTKCSEVCPTGAILPLTVEEKKLTQVGIVKFIKENCVVYTDETLCGACSEHCPTKAVKMVPYKEKLNIPHVETDICVGCGACEHACPVRPYRAIYVDGNSVHKVAKAPKEEKLQEQKLEEFPF